MGAKSNVVNKPGDIDLIRMEGGQKIGYELKDRDYDMWKIDGRIYTDLDDINKGFQKIIAEGDLGISDYKIVFREEPPSDVQTWLNSRNIPWDYFVK
jgi:hypothetical protein